MDLRDVGSGGVGGGSWITESGNDGIRIVGIVGCCEPTGTIAEDAGLCVTGPAIDCVTIAGFRDRVRQTKYAAVPVNAKIQISSAFISHPRPGLYAHIIKAKCLRVGLPSFQRGSRRFLT